MSSPAASSGDPCRIRGRPKDDIEVRRITRQRMSRPLLPADGPGQPVGLASGSGGSRPSRPKVPTVAMGAAAVVTSLFRGTNALNAEPLLSPFLPLPDYPDEYGFRDYTDNEGERSLQSDDDRKHHKHHGRDGRHKEDSHHRPLNESQKDHLLWYEKHCRHLDICFSKDSGHCFEEHSPQFCLHAIWHCTKLVLSGKAKGCEPPFVEDIAAANHQTHLASLNVSRSTTARSQLQGEALMAQQVGSSVWLLSLAILSAVLGFAIVFKTVLLQRKCERRRQDCRTPTASWAPLLG
eukprot:TRINITY_DN10514_c0_g1_i1.p1 TRINITY_DN10514_c0_g1~~TRINITY_DN10514_c0_g1_i1.p1  ORF type:complete len:293 (-),score=46.26 TRINITY_DN10514_c0_g1_i1:231-1109(-)